jgi:peptidyl-prolyl isomerase G (cyclophilin G)
MEDSPEPRNVTRHRRQSDNVVDEGLRGRPRQRSGSRSASRPLSTHSEDDETEDSTDRSSPTKMHKRKRSASPSRHGDGERRRRSLPNQYRDDRFNRPREDEDRYRPSPRRDDYRHPSRRHNDDPRYPERRQDDRYRPSRERNPYHNAQEDYGRLGGGSYDEYEPTVKFKGRGVMKYQEPGRLS